MIYQPLVSLITVNYRNDEDTKALLYSLHTSTYKQIEMIIVNNAVVEDPSSRFRQIWMSANIINSEKNLGFAGGNNLGLQQATGKYIFFINNDAVLLPNTIECLVETLENNPQLGAISPKIAYAASPDTLQYAGFTKIHPLTGRNSSIGRGEKDRGQFCGLHTTAYAHGAAMMVRSSAIAKIGDMDERYFLYYEELDYCERLREAGYKMAVQGDAKVLHKASASVGVNSPLQGFYHTRNRKLFMKKFYKLWQYGLFNVYYLLMAIPYALWKSRRQPKMQQAIWKGLWAIG